MRVSRPSALPCYELLLSAQKKVKLAKPAYQRSAGSARHARGCDALLGRQLCERARRAHACRGGADAAPVPRVRRGRRPVHLAPRLRRGDGQERSEVASNADTYVPGRSVRGTRTSLLRA
eukprot:scaffold31444_cov34-Phaeocystis_antarctica.AAC.2